MVNQVAEEFEFFVEGIGLVCVGLAGLVLNCLCIITFSRIPIQKNFHRLMLSLSLFDILYIANSILLFGLPALVPGVYESSLYRRMIPVILPLIHVGLTGSIYLTVAIALERYTTVCHPFFKLTHAWSASTYILPICTFSLLYNIPKFFELEISVEPMNGTHYNSSIQFETNNQTDYSSTMEDMLPVYDESTPLYTDSSTLYADSSTLYTDNSTLYNQTIDFTEEDMERVVPSSLRLNPLYIQVYIIYLNLVVHGLVPLILLGSLNILTYSRLRLYHNSLENSATQQGTLQLREVRLSQVSLGIVGVFVFCHGIRWIPNIWELRQANDDKSSKLDWPAWIAYITSLSHLLTVFNSSVNFCIYLMKHPTVLRRLYRSGSENMNGPGTDVTTVIHSKKVSQCINPNIILTEEMGLRVGTEQRMDTEDIRGMDTPL